MVAGLATVAAVGGAGYLAFRKGAMRDLISRGIKAMAGVRDSRFIGALEGLHAWSEAAKDRIEEMPWLGKGGLIDNLPKMFTEMEEAAVRGVANRRRIASEGLTRGADSHLGVERWLTQTSRAAGALADSRFEDEVQRNEEILRLHPKLVEKWRPQVMADSELQRELLKTTGHRRATVSDLLGRGYFRNDKRMQTLVDQDATWLNAVADENLWVDAAGDVADLRDADNLFSGFLNSLESDFGLPIVGFNPMRMFHVSTMLGTRNKSKPFVYALPKEMMQPTLTGDAGAFGRDAVFIGGNVFSLDDAGELALEESNMYLVHSQEKLLADPLRKMAGKAATTYKDDGFLSPVFRALHLGQQDAPVDRFDPTNPATWAGGIINPFLGQNGKLNPLKVDESVNLKHVYGPNTEWVVMRGLKTPGKGHSAQEILSQFVAGRDNMDQVTTGTMFLYEFFDRLNSGLNSVGIGLPTSDLGSAGAIFTNLLKYRVAPVIGGMYGWKYLNYESEKIFGEGVSPEDMAADAYVGMSVDLAHMRDALGITDWAKHTAHLFPGGHFISELPVIGNLFEMNKSAEETKEYWENGEDPVRRGRFWPAGNTAWIGGKVDRYEANWYRKLKSEWEYTDTLYGSEDEYWENAPIPTLRYPLAPIRHFFTDPYHFDLKHYYDRPYPLTGGIPELEEFPLIGPLLNSTVGQLLKPTRVMHPEAWAPAGSGVPGVGPGMIVDTGPTTPDAIMPALPAGMSLPQGVPDPLGAAAGEEEKLGEKDVRMAAYVTASGNVEIMRYDAVQTSLAEARGLLSAQSAERAGFKTARPANALPDAPVGGMPMITPGERMGGEFLYNATEMAGFYGFSLNSIMGESGTGPTGPRLADSGQITSYSRAWWDLDMGGFGGNISEIGRRFLPKEDHSQDINPIRNQMPEWLPGGEYFGGGFKTGDPYVEVKNGEMRLPGAAYEALYEVPEVAQMMQIPEIKAMVDARVLKRGDLYGPLTRYRILADVAPYSEQFRQMDASISRFPLSEKERTEVQEIRQQVQDRKDNLQVTPYRFKYADVATRQVTVKRVIEDPHAGFMVVTDEYPHNPIKLAGLRVPMGANDPVSGAAREYLRGVLSPGHKVTVQVSADPHNMVSNDSYDSIRAVVLAGGTNVNRYLIEQGLAKEDEDDFSAPAVYARFSAAEITVGRIWEEISHYDSIVNTKYLQARSALEMYERKDLYGKGYQEWTEPVDDYLIPTVQAFMRHNPLFSTAMGAFFGSRFGTSPYGRLIGAVIGGSVIGAGSLYREMEEAVTGEAWIPGRRKEEREVNEYFDMLKYVKYMGLYGQAAKESQAAGFSVEEYLEREKGLGEYRSERKRFLQEGKKQIQLDPGKAAQVANQLRIAGPSDAKSIVKAINQEIKQLANERSLDAIPEKAAQAIMYYREAQRTMYAYDAGDPLQDLMAALPKRDREYLPEFIKAPAQERERILDVVPDYMKRPLQAAWGMEVDDKPALTDYFARHGLPDANWSGWRPDVSLDAVKIKFINREGLDRSEFGIYPQDQERAMLDPTPVPVMNRERSPEAVRGRLEQLLKGAGVEDLEIEVLPGKGGVNVSVDIRRDRRKEIEAYMTENKHEVFLG